MISLLDKTTLPPIGTKISFDRIEVGMIYSHYPDGEYKYIAGTIKPLKIGCLSYPDKACAFHSHPNSRFYYFGSDDLTEEQIAISSKYAQ
jgi:hypothetical protein